MYNVPMIFDLPVDVKKIMLVPAMQELQVSERSGKLAVMVPEFSCHCAIVFEYKSGDF